MSKEKKQARRIRSNVVIKSDRLVNAKYEYSIHALKLANVIISMIHKYNEKRQLITEQHFSKDGYKISYRVLSELMGITDYDYLKQTIVAAIDNLDRGKIWVSPEMYVNLISAVHFGTDGVLTFYFHSSVEEHLLNLKKRFVKYKTENILRLNTAYSIRLYELIMSGRYKGKLKITLTELRHALNITGPAYDRYNNIKNRVLEPSKKLIEENTDIVFLYREIKVPKKKEIGAIEFYNIKYKDQKNNVSIEIPDFENELTKHEQLQNVDYSTIRVPDENKNSSLYNHSYRVYYSSTFKNMPQKMNFEDYLKMQGFRVREYPGGGKTIDAIQTKLNI